METSPLSKPAEEGAKGERFFPFFNMMQSLLAGHSGIPGGLAEQKPVPLDEVVRQGTCPDFPGRLVINGTEDDETGDITVTQRYEDYCVDGWTFTGIITVKGNTVRDAFVLIFEELTGTDRAISFTLAGRMTIEEGGFQFNTAVRDNRSGKVYRLEDYLVSFGGFFADPDGGSGDLIGLVGRFYDPDEGFVAVATIESFGTNIGAVFPSFGLLEIRGVEGTSARLTALNGKTIKVEVDADGDGTFDVTTGVVEWTALGNIEGRSELRQIASLKIEFAGDGRGAVTSDPPGIACRSACSASFKQDDVVMLKAAPDLGSAFSGWGGDPDCLDGVVSVVADRRCIAIFSASSELIEIAKRGFGQDEAANIVIRDQTAWEAFWWGGRDPLHSLPPLPAIDFNSRMVVAVMLGTRPTGGYDVKIQSVRDAGTHIEADYIETAPGPDCMVIQILTSPHHVVSAPRSNKPVVFVKHITEVPCSGTPSP